MEKANRFSMRGRRGKTRTLEEKFWDYVELIPFHTCWEWSGSNDDNGYPRIAPVRSKKIGNPDGRKSPMKASRVSWELHYGPIPPNLYVLHKCDNPGCVNPFHLFLGTMKDNSQDMAMKGRSIKGRIFKPICKDCGKNKEIIKGLAQCRPCTNARKRRERKLRKQKNIELSLLCQKQ